MSRFHVVIPARFASSRLPGKPLRELDGKPMIQWVWESARACGAASVIIATDDARILDAAAKFGALGVMTAPDHASGTDRIAEVARSRSFDEQDIIVNLQGDEPLTPPPLLARLAEALEARPDAAMATLVAPIETLAEFLDPNCVKVVRNRDGRALYFSRAPVPWPRDNAVGDRPAVYRGAWRHIGIYAYRVRTLLALAHLSPSGLEVTERLEQLRALESGLSIHTVEVADAPPAGIDTPEDLERVRRILAARASAP